jgi:hypothetical protein
LRSGPSSAIAPLVGHPGYASVDGEECGRTLINAAAYPDAPCRRATPHLFGGIEQRSQWAWDGVLGWGLGMGSWDGVLGWGLAMCGGRSSIEHGAAGHPSPARGRKVHARSRNAVPVPLSTERRGRRPSTVAYGVHLLFEFSSSSPRVLLWARPCRRAQLVLSVADGLKPVDLDVLTSRSPRAP